MSAVTRSGGRLDRTTTLAQLRGAVSCEFGEVHARARCPRAGLVYFASRTSPTTWNVRSGVDGVASTVKRVPTGSPPFSTSRANASFTMATSGADGVSSASSKSRPASSGMPERFEIAAAGPVEGGADDLARAAGVGPDVVAPGAAADRDDRTPARPTRRPGSAASAGQEVAPRLAVVPPPACRAAACRSRPR